MALTAEQVMWFPDPDLYQGRDGMFAILVKDMQIAEITRIVQERASVEGEWLIEHNLVGGNAEKMRRMMAWVSLEKNIHQCVDHIWSKAKADECTVDYVCRELAIASQRIFASM